MQTPFFIYSRSLSNQQLKQFLSLCNGSVKLLGNAVFLDYCMAFFESEEQADFRIFAQQVSCDFSYLDIVPELQTAGVLVMDMDSTAIKIECIDEIAKLAGVGEMVSTITARAMRGELDFEQSLRQRVSALAEMPEDILQKVRENIPLMEGFEQMIVSLRQYGWKLAIASGGFDYFADYLKNRYHLDVAVSNQLEIIDGKLTGRVLGKIVDADYKAEILEQLAEHFSIPLTQCVAVGDGANDLLMLKRAGLGVALHAKPKVQEQADVVVNFGDLTALLVLLNARNVFNSLK